MYPSKEQPVFGVFVKNFENGILENNGTVYKSVISGKGKSKIEKVFKYINFFFSVYKNLLFKKYDIIYVHYSTHSVLPLVLIYKFIKKPIIINAHGDDLLPQSRLSEILFKLTKNCVHNCKMIVVPSKYFANIANEKYNHNNIFVSASGGVNLDIFKKYNFQKEKTDYLNIGYVSRIDKGKGWDIYLKALYELKKLDIKFKAVIVGHGDEITLMQEMINKFKLNDDVKYLGKLPQIELPKIFNDLDVFIFPSVREGESLGLVGLESMACGTPVIGSAIGGIAEYVENSMNGYLFEPDNVEALVEKILKFNSLRDEEKIKMNQNALETAKRFGSQEVAKKLYKKLEGNLKNE
jgi:glycosyltransferase involved in cell wall biosynthesis